MVAFSQPLASQEVSQALGLGLWVVEYNFAGQQSRCQSTLQKGLATRTKSTKCPKPSTSDFSVLELLQGSALLVSMLTH